jgi:sulfatase maturation enzyme AslB (radical SAM superfamily)
MNIPPSQINKKIVAAELFSSALCPLDCQYCYIPKTEAMKGLHEKIVKMIKGKTFIPDLKKFYGENLEHFSLWGAEPTLTLPAITEIMPTLIKEFPKLKGLSFSTSLITNPDIILNAVKSLEKNGVPFSLNCQISLDGPAFITDINRRKGVAETVPKNLYYITEELKNMALKNARVIFHTKATMTMDNIKFMNEKPSRLKEYFDYFEKIYLQFQKINKNKNCVFSWSSSPTLTVPGRYTSSDGKELAIFFKNLRFLDKKNREKKYWQHINAPLNNYTSRFARVINCQNDLTNKASMFTCSGGDSNFALGINHDFRICHRTFFLDNKEYIDGVLMQGNMENWDISSFERGNIELLNEKYSLNIGKRDDWERVLYILRSYHDFTKLRTSYIIAMVRELALCGQADKKFLKDDGLCLLFASFINVAFACHTESLLNDGFLHFIPVSIIRLLSNGAFFEIMEDYNENIQTRE